jgi:hypothetical protein
MGLIRAGRLILTPRRRVDTNDTAHPTSDTQSGAIEIPNNARGVITHVWITITGNAASPSAIVTLMGLPFTTSEMPNFDTTHQGVWLPLVQLNDGGAITQTSITPTAPASNVAYYAESFLHLSAYKKLYAHVTSMTNTAQVDVQFAFEAL